MKKFLLASTLIITSFSSFAQMQVPNGTMESWTTSTCGDKPSQYTTLSEVLQTGAGCPSSNGITKSTSKYSGTYALQLGAIVHTVDVGGAPMPVFSENGLFLGSSGTNQGIIFDGRPTKYTGYTQLSQSGSDELAISVEIDDAFGNKIATGELTLSETQTVYTKFEIILNYTANTNPATKLYISFSIGNANNGISPNTVALIDALEFEYAAATSTTNYSATSPINVFAANKTINFSENVSDVHVVDMVGANKMQETAATKTLNAASLTTGMYIVTYKYNNAYFSKKIIID